MNPFWFALAGFLVGCGFCYLLGLIGMSWQKRNETLDQRLQRETEDRLRNLPAHRPPPSPTPPPLRIAGRPATPPPLPPRETGW